MSAEWGANWLHAWVATPPVRNRTALVVVMDAYDDPIVTVAHFDPATGWRSICGSGSVRVTHWMALPPLPDGVLPRWARATEEVQP